LERIALSSSRPPT